MLPSANIMWIFSKSVKHSLLKLTLWCLFLINHKNDYALHFFIQDSRSSSNGGRDRKTYHFYFIFIVFIAASAEQYGCFCCCCLFVYFLKYVLCLASAKEDIIFWIECSSDCPILCLLPHHWYTKIRCEKWMDIVKLIFGSERK